MKMVRIEWVDSHSPSHKVWRTHEEIEEGAKHLNIVSVGWLLKRTRDVTLIVQNKYGKNPNFKDFASGEQVIPNCAIRKMREVR